VILVAEFLHCETNGERDKTFWYCLTPQSPWLQHLRLANGLAGWRQGGVGLRGEENNGLERLSQHYLAASLSPLLTLFFPPINLANQWQLHAVEGEYAHFTNTHTLQERTKSVGVG